MLLLYGPQGSGRSTLFAMMMGLMAPDIGEVLLKGESIYNLSERERNFVRMRRIGIVPSKHLFIKGLNVEQNLILPLILIGMSRAEAKAKTEQICTEFGLQELLKRPFRSISSLQQQMVAITRAFLIDPWVIFADEPYMGLNTQDANRIMEFLSQINQEKKITVIVSLGDVRYISAGKKLLFIHDGRVESQLQTGNALDKLKQALLLTSEQPSA